MDNQLLREQTGDILTLTLNRPEKRNAMTLPMLRGLREAVREVGDLPDVRVVIVAGAGKSFCAGLDLQEIGDSRAADGAVELPEIEDALHALERCAVPTIAMMQGGAIAGGLELALHCDLRIAGAGARMGMPLARLGLVVPYPLTQKLLDTAGTVQTRELLFTGALLDAAAALAAGLVNRVVPDIDLPGATRALAEEIAANAPLALRAMKAAINEANEFRPHTPSAAVAELAAAARRSEDVREGVKAMLERRRPTFHGR